MLIPACDTGVRATLVGCVATKAAVPMAAKDLYTSSLFRARRAYAESRGEPWFIVSALLGLVDPEEAIDPYEKSLSDLSAGERSALGERVGEALEARLGSLAGATLEIHMGNEYRRVIGPPLTRRGARLVNPVARLRIGEQLAWYREHARGDASSAGSRARTAPAATAGADVAARMTHVFRAGELDLSGRVGAPEPGWAGMPEVAVARQLRARGADSAQVRVLLTLVAALDRARDADALWRAAGKLHEHDAWALDPEQLVAAPLTELGNSLRRHRVSQRHVPDAAAWRTIAESLLDPHSPVAVRNAVFDGAGSAPELLDALRATTHDGTPYFPYLRGPKVGPMWIRMLAVPGEAGIEQLDSLPVAVDVQVRKVTEYLDITQTQQLGIEQARPIIQDAWSESVASHGADGPGPLANTCAALDPALWFWGKWGCTICEHASRRIPIAAICHERCRALN